MDFSFTPEQEALRREARAFLEANPSPSLEQLDELGWVGILENRDSEDSDFTFLDAAVLFEELGRVLYDGPYVLNEIAAQPGDDVWSIEIDGFVPHLEQVGRVLTPDMQGPRAAGETVATVDETLGLGRVSTNGAERAEGDWEDVRLHGEAGHRIGRVAADSRELGEVVGPAGFRDPLGGTVEVDGATVVAEPLPLADDLRPGRGREGLGGRPALEPVQVPRDDALHLRLLEHDLADEDRVRIACPPPRQVASLECVPVAEGPLEVSHRAWLPRGRGRG